MGNPPKRTCRKCGLLKEINEFQLRSDSRTHRHSCLHCENTRKSNWYQGNKDRLRYKYVAHKYGLSKEDYEFLVNEHDDLCSICKKPETSLDGKSGVVKSLSIDHCHKTGKVRGLLCWMCNGMIGRANDDIAILTSAINYLRKYE